MAVFTIKGTMLDQLSRPIQGGILKFTPSPGVNSDGTNDLTYIGEPRVMTNALGFFTIDLQYDNLVAYQATGEGLLTGYQSSKFESPAIGSITDIADITPVPVTYDQAQIYYQGPPGPPGPKGDDRVFVSSTPPPSPKEGDIWIQI